MNFFKIVSETWIFWQNHFLEQFFSSSDFFFLVYKKNYVNFLLSKLWDYRVSPLHNTPSILIRRVSDSLSLFLFSVPRDSITWSLLSEAFSIKKATNKEVLREAPLSKAYPQKTSAEVWQKKISKMWEETYIYALIHQTFFLFTWVTICTKKTQWTKGYIFNQINIHWFDFPTHILSQPSCFHSHLKKRTSISWKQHKKP